MKLLPLLLALCGCFPMIVPKEHQTQEPQQAIVWWILAIIYIVLIVAQMLLTPKPKIENARPKALGEFDFPTASEGRAIPVVFGQALVRAPNVIWYGDLFAHAIRKNVGRTMGWGSKNIHLGFTYEFGMNMAICYGPIDQLVSMKVGTKAIVFGNDASNGNLVGPLPVNFTGTEVDGVLVTIFRPYILGGEQHGGGLSGHLRVYPGIPNQNPNVYLEGRLGAGQVPGYPDLAHAVWERGTFGESSTIPPWGFEVARWPNQLGVTGGHHKIGGPKVLGYEFKGAADGALGQFSLSAGAVTQTWTIKFTSSTAFNITGSVSGAQGSGTVGTPASSSNAQFHFLVTAGSTAFRSGEKFVVSVSIGFDCNPICALYEIYTDAIWGLNGDTSVIDVASWRAAADTIFTEQNGFSYVLTSQTEARDLADVILQQCDAILYPNQDGKIIMKLVRSDYSIPALPVYDESNIIAVSNFGRGAWNQTSNNVQLTFTERGRNYLTTAARAQDMGNIRLQGGVNVIAAPSFPGVLDGDNAAALAARELRRMSYPLAKAKLVVNRAAARYNPGDVIKWSWPRYSIQNMVLRVVAVDRGDFDQGAVTLDCIEDIFAIQTASFSKPKPSRWITPNTDAIAAAVEYVIDMPRWFSITDPTTSTIPGERFLSFVLRPQSFVSSFVVDADDGLGAGYEEVGEADNCTPTALIKVALLGTEADTGGTIDVNTMADFTEINIVTADQIAQFGNGLAWIEGTSAIGDEIIGFEGITDLGGGDFRLTGVHRGLLDTLPLPHSVGARIWFFSDGSGISGLRVFGATQSINVKNLTRTPNSLLLEADATARPLTFSSRYTRPYPPGFFRVNAARYPTALGAADVTVTWEHRNLNDAIIEDQSVTGVPQDNDIEYVLTFYKPGPTVIRTVVLDHTSPPPVSGPVGGGSSWTSYVYPRASVKTDAGAPSGAFTLRADLVARSKSSSLTSRVIITRTFTVTLP